MPEKLTPTEFELLAGAVAYYEVVLEDSSPRRISTLNAGWEKVKERYVQPTGIIGRDRALTDRTARSLHHTAERTWEATRLREDRRGSWFEVRITGPDGKPTGHIARITIELDRVEDPNDWSS